MNDNDYSEEGQDENEQYNIKEWKKMILGTKWQKGDSLAELWSTVCCFVHGTFEQ